jgi:hypothetical protein
MSVNWLMFEGKVGTGEAYLEADNVCLRCPFINQWFQDLRHLIHLDQQ